MMPAQPDVFYPIVPDLDWLQRIVPLGVKTVQLRIKDTSLDNIRQQIATALPLCRKYNCQLIINDYWAIAIELGADYIHLGQEDLAAADLVAIKQAGLKIGISTHDKAERNIAIEAEPDYIALGPIYETKLKVMKWDPQGLERVSTWASMIGTTPLVGIGGITPDRAPQVVAAGASSIAVITDFLTHADPEARIKQWLEWAGAVRSK